MLVEDDNNLREIYEARLLAEGYEIVAAKDGEEALALAVKERPDLIISDVMMPKISGFDMLDILRSTAETKNTKVIMMTALSQAEDKARADKLGADRYLVKSQVTLEDVAKVASDVLNGVADGAPSTPTEPAQPAEAPQDATASVAPVVAPTLPEPTAAAAPVNEPAEDEAPVVTPITLEEPVEAPEPVVDTPAPEPSQEPAPTTEVEPVAETEAVQESVLDTPEEATNVESPVEESANDSFGGISNDLNLSTEDEKAAAEAQINEILAQSSPIDPADEPSVVTPPPELEEVPAPTQSLHQSAEAPVDTIEVTSAPDEPAAEPTVSTPTVIPIAGESEAEPTPEVVEPTVQAPTAPEPAAQPEAPVSNSVPINNKKVVIAPISDVTKGPDLNELLKREEDMNAMPTPGATAVVTPGSSTPVDPAAGQAEAPVPPAQTGSVISPSDISL